MFLLVERMWIFQVSFNFLRLLSLGHEVTLLNRGASPALVAVEQLYADRKDRVAVRKALAGREWDAVYDVSASVQVASVEDIEDMGAPWGLSRGR